MSPERRTLARRLTNPHLRPVLHRDTHGLPQSRIVLKPGTPPVNLGIPDQPRRRHAATANSPVAVNPLPRLRPEPPLVHRPDVRPFMHLRGTPNPLLGKRAPINPLNPSRIPQRLVGELLPQHANVPERGRRTQSLRRPLPHLLRPR